MPFGTSLVVQWLRLCLSTAGGVGWIPSQETKIPNATLPKNKNPKRMSLGNELCAGTWGVAITTWADIACCPQHPGSISLLVLELRSYPGYQPSLQIGMDNGIKQNVEWSFQSILQRGWLSWKGGWFDLCLNPSSYLEGRGDGWHFSSQMTSRMKTLH